MSELSVRRQHLLLLPDSERVILRPFIPGDARRILTILGRALAFEEMEVVQELQAVREDFDARHLDIDTMLMATFRRVQQHLFTNRPISRERQLLIGALFSGEYALEAAALFNPSIVPHPDQEGLKEGELRFILSLRATGEGHISSIEFRSGILSAENDLVLDPVSRFVSAPLVAPNPSYRKASFILKMHEMGCDNACADSAMAPLGDEFTRTDLAASVARTRRESRPLTHDARRTLECIQWLADSNYELEFDPTLSVSERIIFPVSSNESNGIEDARFVRFVEEDGSQHYYATYTAYNGRAILPQFIETTDFLHFRVLTLNGGAVQNKGMALFPRKINGRYAMLSRQDDENLFIMLSDNAHYWNDPQLLLRPAEPWEVVKVGNCGSPLETEAGWLVITHGVGAMRTYSIGAVLLDLEDPTKVIGRLKEPLLRAEGAEREGYVPNVVYSCGALIHQGELVLPYAMSDKATGFARVPLDQLLGALTAQ
jgi:predicted GH43/DUF377 family glycosyl hydrolase